MASKNPELNAPKDRMFRAGQISSKNWARLSMNANGKGGKTKGRMANFDSKFKTDGKAVSLGHTHTQIGHIDGPDQGMTAKGAFTGPTGGGPGPIKGAGGRVPNPGGKPSASDGARKFPKQGSGRAPKAYSRQQPSSSNYPAKVRGNDQYGGPSSRPNKPSRLGRAETGGSKF